MPDDEASEPFVVTLNSGPLSPAEDLETAIIVAAQSQAFGQTVLRIEQGAEVILEGEELWDAIAQRQMGTTPII